MRKLTSICRGAVILATVVGGNNVSAQPKQDQPVREALPIGVTQFTDVAQWSKIRGYSTKCLVLDVSPGSVWNFSINPSAPEQSVAASIGLGSSCGFSWKGWTVAASKSVGPVRYSLGPDQANMIKLAGGAYIVVIMSYPIAADITLSVQPATESQTAHAMRLSAGGLPPGTPTVPLTGSVTTSQTGDSGASAKLPHTASTSQSPTPRAVAAGTILRDCPDICPQMVALPRGAFLMGSSSDEPGRAANEGPRHLVTFARPFAVSKYEITFAEWDACAADHGCAAGIDDKGWGRGKRPVINVSQADAMSYAAWLSKKTGEKYFLLSEAEWEYSARAGTSTPWNTGAAIITDDANFLSQFKQTVPVGGFAPNAFGLHDMHGNVAERTQDCADVGYFGSPSDGSASTEGRCELRIVRGGGSASPPERVRSAFRLPLLATQRSEDVGFRIGRAL